jgi:hypothetical protein
MYPTAEIPKNAPIKDHRTSDEDTLGGLLVVPFIFEKKFIIPPE